MDGRTKEAIRYLGYGKNVVDDKTLQMIHESLTELELIAKPKHIILSFETNYPNQNDIQIGKLNIQSKDLYKNLCGCDIALLFAATLGTDVDRQIHKYELVDIARAVVFQACAAAYLEEYIDGLQERIVKMPEMEKCYIRPRFSPGYGDFSIIHQKDILRILDASKKIGLTMTDGFMLTPTKSVTAVIGVDTRKRS